MLITLPPLFVLMCAVGVLFYSAWMAKLSDRTIRRSEESIIQGERVLRVLVEIHMEIRGYVRSRRGSLLTGYAADVTELNRALEALRDLEAGEADQVGQVDTLAADFIHYRSEWAEPAMEKVRTSAASDPEPLVMEGDKRLAEMRDLTLALIQEDRAENAALLNKTDLMTRHMLELGVGLAVLLAGVLLFLTRLMGRVITHPVEQLIDASERVSRGDFQPVLPPALAENEFGKLSRTFSHMTSALRREREELAALNKFSEAVTQCTTDREVYDHILHSLKERFQPQQIMIFRLNPSENILEVGASLVPLPEQVRQWPVIEEPHDCKAVRAGRHFSVNDAAREPLCPSKFAPPASGSYYCGPLIASGNVIGAVRVEGSKDPWTPERETLIESYLSGAAAVLSNLRLLQSMKEQATVDELTGLHNRRFLEEYAQKLIAISSRKSSPFGLLMLDLDHFKDFNDVHGHEVGDRILRQFAKTILQAMRQANLAARYGGEEFVVLLPETSANASQVVAERIRKAVEKMIVESGTGKTLQRVTVSLGIAVYPDHGNTFEEIIHAADKALYESKRAGRNRSTLYVEQAEPAT